MSHDQLFDDQSGEEQLSEGQGYERAPDQLVESIKELTDSVAEKYGTHRDEIAEYRLPVDNGAHIGFGIFPSERVAPNDTTDKQIRLDVSLFSEPGDPVYGVDLGPRSKHTLVNLFTDREGNMRALIPDKSDRPIAKLRQLEKAGMFAVPEDRVALDRLKGTLGVLMDPELEASEQQRQVLLFAATELEELIKDEGLFHASYRELQSQFVDRDTTSRRMIVTTYSHIDSDGDRKLYPEIMYSDEEDGGTYLHLKGRFGTEEIIFETAPNKHKNHRDILAMALRRGDAYLTEEELEYVRQSAGDGKINTFTSEEIANNRLMKEGVYYPDANQAAKFYDLLWELDNGFGNWVAVESVADFYTESTEEKDPAQPGN